MATATGWTIDYILNKVNYQTLIMMLSDAPRYIEEKSGKTDSSDSATDEAGKVIQFFQSNLTK